MKKILVIVFNDLRHDARVTRQVNFLTEKYDVTVACFDAPESIACEVIRIKRIRPTFSQKLITSFFLFSQQYERAWQILYGNRTLQDQLNSRQFDLVIANDIETVPLAFALKKNARIIFDAHEYAPRHFEDKMIWRIFFQSFNRFHCARYIPQVDAMTTVGEGLAKEYEKNYQVKPLVITNANYYYDLTPAAVSDKIRLIHHGAANPSRQLELTIDMMQDLDNRFTLDLMLLTPSIANKKTRTYLEFLKDKVKRDERIRILDPVKSHEVVQAIHPYDVGIFLLPPVNFNYANTLPNKLFDFIQARLAVAIGPTPEMAQIVKKYDLGVVSPDFTPAGMAKVLSGMTREKIERFKAHAHKAAPDLSADTNKKILHDLVAQLLF